MVRQLVGTVVLVHLAGCGEGSGDPASPDGAPVRMADAAPADAALPDAAPLPANRPLGVNLPFLYWQMAGLAGYDQGRERARASLHAARTGPRWTPSSTTRAPRACASCRP